MRRFGWEQRVLLAALAALMSWSARQALAVDAPAPSPSTESAVAAPAHPEWCLDDVYSYCEACGDTLTPPQKEAYAQFIIDQQDPKTGLFVDRHGHCVYSVKAYQLLQRLGDYKPRYPLAVCGEPRFAGTVSEQMGAEAFRRWLNDVMQRYDAYSAGSLIGHFLTPHYINLRNAGQSPDSSEYIREFRRWALENQRPNGFWMKDSDPAYNGWNGLLKMEGCFAIAGIPVPNPDRIVQTILASRNDATDSFGPGMCTDYNALAMLTKFSRRNGDYMRDEVIAALEWYVTGLERRYDAATGEFWDNDAWAEKNAHADRSITIAQMGVIRGYCRGLLRNTAGPTDSLGAMRPRVEKLLERVTALYRPAVQKRREHEQKYNPARPGAGG